MLTPDTDIGINRRTFHLTIIFKKIIIVSFELWDKKTIFDHKSHDIRAKETTFHNRPNCEKTWVGGKVLIIEVGRNTRWKLIENSSTAVSTEYNYMLFSLVFSYYKVLG